VLANTKDDILVTPFFKSNEGGAAAAAADAAATALDDDDEAAAAAAAADSGAGDVGVGGDREHGLLATTYGVLCLEAFSSTLAKPGSLPLLRCAVLAVLHKNAFDANPQVLASEKFKALNSGLLSATFAMFSTGGLGGGTGLGGGLGGLLGGGRLVPIACLVAAFKGTNVHQSAQKALLEKKENAVGPGRAAAATG
jgi:hypothetical protein